MFWVEWYISVFQRWYKQILLGPEVSWLFPVNVICMHLLMSGSAIMKSNMRRLNGWKQLFTGFQDAFGLASYGFASLCFDSAELESPVFVEWMNRVRGLPNFDKQSSTICSGRQGEHSMVHFQTHRTELIEYYSDFVTEIESSYSSNRTEPKYFA